jgi:hypothetical protein
MARQRDIRMDKGNQIKIKIKIKIKSMMKNTRCFSCS